MGVIRKIEIKNFRSIHHLVIEDASSDLNILVGNNDIGKSNILRALNLFFNEETDIGSPINFWEDFNKNVERTSGKGQYIKITLEINLKYEKEKYVRWSKEWDNEGRLKANKKVYTFDHQLSDFVDKSRAKGWLDRIIFRYVPAVKSSAYFQHLFEELHDLMDTTYSAQFKKDTGALITGIQNITEDITNELKETLGIENKISLPADLKTFFGTLDFSLDIDDKKFNLKSRGDGIKARHIPILLKFMASKAKVYKRGALDIQTIWGFEEPENNLEMSHAFDLARNFLKYSESIHIFLSTHSPAFYSLKNHKDKVACWFAERDEYGYTSLVMLKEDSSIDLDERMGMIGYVTPFLLQKNLEISQHLVENARLKKEVESLKDTTKVVVFSEDEGDDLSMIKSFMNIQGFDQKETEYHSYHGKDNFNGALIAADTFCNKNPNIKAVILHRDMDVDGEHFLDKNRKRLTSNGRKNYFLYMPKGYDIESEFLNAEHINAIYKNVSVVEANSLIEEATKEAEGLSLEKLKNVYLKVKVKQQLNQGIKLDDIKFNRLYEEVEDMYLKDTKRYRYGKKVLGILIGKLQKKLGSNANIIAPSEFIKVKELLAVSQSI